MNIGKAIKSSSIFGSKEESPGTPDPTVFDQNSFEFELTGGPKHSDLLAAHAYMKQKDGSKGAPLPLHCTWYSATVGGQLKEIQGVVGAFYQPSVDDVGSRICVHAIPASDAMEYEGMPAFAETGPLEMDSNVEEAVQKILEGLNTEITFKLEHISPSLSYKLEELQDSQQISKLKLPANCKASIVQDKLRISNEEQEILSYQITEEYPHIQIKKHTHSKFTIALNKNEKLQCAVSTAAQRDVFTVIYRYHCGRVIQHLLAIKGSQEKQEEENAKIQEKPEEEAVSEVREAGSQNSQITPRKEIQPKESFSEEKFERKNGRRISQVVQLEQLSREVSRLSQDKQKVNQKMHSLSNQNELLQKKLSQCLEQLHQKTLKIERLERDKVELDETVSYLQSQKIFLEKEMDSLNSKVQEFQKIYLEEKRKEGKQLDSAGDLTPLQKIKAYWKKRMIHERKKFLKVRIEVERLKMVQQDRDINWVNRSKDKSAELQQLESQVSAIDEDLKLTIIEKEDLLVERNHLKKKIESLALENEKLNRSIKGGIAINLKGENSQSQASSQFNIINAIHVPDHLNLSIEEDLQLSSRSDEELEKAKQKIAELERVVESYKRVLDKEISKSHSLKKLADQRGTSKNIQQYEKLQKLVNNLTQTITEKELELEAQKHINRELVSKMQLIVSKDSQ